MSNLNPLEVYAEAGAKAARAVNVGDAATCKFHKEWMQRAVALETPQWAAMARKVYADAYAAARKI